MIVVWVHYCNSSRVSLRWQFPTDKAKEAIETAQMYSEDPFVLNTQVILNELIMLAQFAGYYEGRVYEA